MELMMISIPSSRVRTGLFVFELAVIEDGLLFVIEVGLYGAVQLAR